MSKPDTIVLTDREIPFREVCEMFGARYAWLDGAKYRLPDSWRKEKKDVDMSLII